VPPPRRPPRTAPPHRGGRPRLEAMYSTFPRMKSMYFQTAAARLNARTCLGCRSARRTSTAWPRSPLHRFGPRNATWPRLPVSPAGPATAAVALSASVVAPQDSRAHAGARPPARGVPRCSIPVDAPGPRRSIGLGLQPDCLHPEFGCVASTGRRPTWAAARFESGPRTLRRASGFPSPPWARRGLPTSVSATLNTDPVGTVQRGLRPARMRTSDGLGVSGSVGRMARGGRLNPRGAHGTHEYSLESSASTRAADAATLFPLHPTTSISTMTQPRLMGFPLTDGSFRHSWSVLGGKRRLDNGGSGAIRTCRRP